MTKYRILKTTRPGYADDFVPQRRLWWCPVWENIGVSWACDTEKEALAVIQDYKNRHDNRKDIIIWVE